MPRFGPIKRRELIVYLRRLGFQGPYAGGNTSLTIPNLHARDIGPKLLGMILRQGGIERSEWERL